jgi:hypothetical protein
MLVVEIPDEIWIQITWDASMDDIEALGLVRDSTRLDAYTF